MHEIVRHEPKKKKKCDKIFNARFVVLIKFAVVISLNFQINYIIYYFSFILLKSSM